MPVSSNRKVGPRWYALFYEIPSTGGSNNTYAVLAVCSLTSELAPPRSAFIWDIGKRRFQSLPSKLELSWLLPIWGYQEGSFPITHGYPYNRHESWSSLKKIQWERFFEKNVSSVREIFAEKMLSRRLIDMASSFNSGTVWLWASHLTSLSLNFIS